MSETARRRWVVEFILNWIGLSKVKKSSDFALVHIYLVQKRRRRVKTTRREKRKFCHIYSREVHLNAKEMREIIWTRRYDYIRTHISKFNALAEDFSKSSVVVAAWLKHKALEMNSQCYYCFGCCCCYEVSSSRNWTNVLRLVNEIFMPFS